MAREQVGVAPNRGPDVTDVSYVTTQIAAVAVGIRVIGEIPTGLQDGTNTLFTTAYDFQAGTTDLYRNGLREHLGHGYSESAPDTLVFSTPPLSDDDIVVSYMKQ